MERGLLWFSSPFSVAVLELLERVGAPPHKVASGEVTNPPLIRRIPAAGKPLLARLVAGVRQVEAALGSGEKPHDPSPDPVCATFEKRVVAPAPHRRRHCDRGADAHDEAPGDWHSGGAHR